MVSILLYRSSKFALCFIIRSDRKGKLRIKNSRGFRASKLLSQDLKETRKNLADLKLTILQMLSVTGGVSVEALWERIDLTMGYSTVVYKVYKPYIF